MIFTFRRSAISAALAGAIALSGCGGADDSVEAQNESAEAVAEKVAKVDIRPNPGRWETRFQIEKMAIPGMPPEMQQMMKQQMGKVQTSFSCLTPEEADRPGEDFFQPGGSGCTYQDFSMGGGKIDAAMTCDSEGQTQKLNMSGTYSEDSYTMDIKSEGTTDQGQPIAMDMTVAGKRVGACTGEEDA